MLSIFHFLLKLLHILLLDIWQSLIQRRVIIIEQRFTLLNKPLSLHHGRHNKRILRPQTLEPPHLVLQQRVFMHLLHYWLQGLHVLG